MKCEGINQKGMATVETVLLLFLFVLFMSFTTGFFSVIHVGILNSISARAYAFEVMRNRSNVTYHRNPVLVGKADSMVPVGFRVHGVVRQNSGDEWKAQEVYISIPKDTADASNPSRRPSTESKGLPMPDSINPVFIKTAYGICLDTKCGGT